MRRRRQRKTTKDQNGTRYLLTFPTIDDYAKALSLLLEDGPVDCLAYGDHTMTALATRTQIQKLEAAGIEWEYVKPDTNSASKVTRAHG
jgi:hypothetical protein